MVIELTSIAWIEDPEQAQSHAEWEVGEFQWRHAQLLCCSAGMGLYFRVFRTSSLRAVTWT